MKKLLAWWNRYRIGRLEGALGKRRGQRITELETQVTQLQADLKDEREHTRHFGMVMKHQAYVIERDDLLLRRGVGENDKPDQTDG